MFFDIVEDKLDIGGVHVGHIAFGRGEKPMVMIQGLNTRGIKGAGFQLAWMYRIFAKDYRVHLFDRRPDVRDGVTVRDLAEDVAAAMDVLGITDADVLGVSQGGMIGQYLAIDRPDLIRRLVLAVTLSRNNTVVESVIDTWITMTRESRYKELVADMAEKMYSEAYLKRYKMFMPLLTVLQKPKDVQRFMTLAKSCLTCNAYDELAEIKCPVLVIGGMKDRLVGGDASIELAEKLAERIANEAAEKTDLGVKIGQCGDSAVCSQKPPVTEIYMYENLGHAAYEEAKDFNKRVYRFFSA